MPYATEDSLESHLLSYFILFLWEELEHIWELVQFEEEQDWAVQGRDDGVCALQPSSYLQEEEGVGEGKDKDVGCLS